MIDIIINITLVLIAVSGFFFAGYWKGRNDESDWWIGRIWPRVEIKVNGDDNTVSLKD